MKVAIDESPLTNSEKLSHRVRGVGYYLLNLKKSLLEEYSQSEFVFVSDIRNLPSDVSLLHFPYFEPFFVTLPLRQKIKTVITVHDLTPLVFPKNFPSGIKGKVKWEIQKRLLKQSARVITDSNSSKNDIMKFTGIDENKIDVVYLAASDLYRKISDKKALEDVRKRYNLPETFVLYVGDVTWNKNLPRLMKAVQKVRVPLVMVGKAVTQTNFDRSNPWNQDLQAVVDLAKDDPLFIRLGFVPDEDLPFLYNLATIFAMPSLYEGFGLPLLEAMGCGVAVVTSNKGSIPEVVGDSAEIVDPYNVDAIANGISSLIKNENARITLGEKGREQAKKFSWKITAEKTYESYKKVYTKAM